MATDKPSIDTRLQHIKTPEAIGGEPVAQPIYQTSTFALPSQEVAAEIASASHPQRYYTRYGSPNNALLEAIVTELEGAEQALAVGSGMAAISSAILANISAGDEVVAQQCHYDATLALLDDWLPRHGVMVRKVDQTDVNAFQQAISEKTRLVLLETPTNPTMSLTDLESISALARTHGALTVADNTFASSFNQQPHRLGVDVVVHSATKYLSGHSDVTAGVITGSADQISTIWEYARVHGPVLHPMEAWLTVRGLKTYALRVRQQNSSAFTIAKALSDHPAINRVFYPGLPSHPQHSLACKQMTGGFGGMLTFEVSGQTPDARLNAARKVLENVKLCTSAASLGGTETLITHPASIIFAHLSASKLIEAGVEPGLLRLSVGLENPQDIIDDVLYAIALR